MTFALRRATGRLPEIRYRLSFVVTRRVVEDVIDPLDAIPTNLFVRTADSMRPLPRIEIDSTFDGTADELFQVSRCTQSVNKRALQPRKFRIVGPIQNRRADMLVFAIPDTLFRVLKQLDMRLGQVKVGQCRGEFVFNCFPNLRMS